MKEYHKIDTPFNRDAEGTKKLIEGDFRNPTVKFLKDLLWLWSEKIDGCLYKDTRIVMSDGNTKQIKDIKVGDYVMGYDVIDGTPIPVMVNAISVKPRGGEWLIIKTTRNGLNKGNSYGVIRCTSNHLIWTSNRGYVEASDLREDDTLISIRTDLALTPIQEQILVGKMLGDGSLCPRSNESVPTAHIEWGQKEKEYTMWCVDGLCGIAKYSGTHTSGYGTQMHVARTYNYPSIYEYFRGWFTSGEKQVPQDIILTPISLAFWYMDDGSLDYACQSQENHVTFSTNGFSSESCQNLINAMKKLDIDASVKDYGKGNVIKLDSKNSEKLFLLIFPYVCESKKYKLPVRYRDASPYIPNLCNDTFHRMVVEQKIISIEKDEKCRKRFDIETDTHNFFTSGGLVHNSNIRIHWDGHNIEIGGRTDKANIPPFLLDYLNNKFMNIETEELFEQLFGEKEVFFYGEGYGARIQNGGNYRSDVSFILFDVEIGDNFQPRETVEEMGKTFNIDVVPIVGEGTIDEAIEFVKTKPKSTIGTADMEGVVARPFVELRDRCGKRVIVKIKVCDFC